MELLTLKEKVLELFGTDIEGLGGSLKAACLNHDEKAFDGFVELVEGDLSKDWLQKIFQYYLADRKEKMQDYTPFLIFNLAVRNIEATLNVGDVLQGEISEIYTVRRGTKYGNVTRIKPSV